LIEKAGVMPAVAATLNRSATARSPALVSSQQAFRGSPGRLPGNGLGCPEGRLGHAAGRLARLLQLIDPQSLRDRDAELRGDFRVRDTRRALARYGLLAGHAAISAEWVAEAAYSEPLAIASIVLFATPYSEARALRVSPTLHLARIFA